jgi:hypothetical protein
VPGVIAFIMITVWSVGLSKSLDRELRSYRAPPGDSRHVTVAEDETSPIAGEVVSTDLGDDGD